MMNFIMVPLIIGIITFGILKLFELFACRKERMMLIERMQGLTLQQPPRLNYGFGLPFSFSALKWGCLLMGIGLGLLLAFFICSAYNPGFVHEGWVSSSSVPAVIFGACMLLMGGLGLLVAFLVEMRFRKEKEDGQ